MIYVELESDRSEMGGWYENLGEAIDEFVSSFPGQEFEVVLIRREDGKEFGRDAK